MKNKLNEILDNNRLWLLLLLSINKLKLKIAIMKLNTLKEKDNKQNRDFNGQ